MRKSAVIATAALVLVTFGSQRPPTKKSRWSCENRHDRNMSSIYADITGSAR